MKFVDAVLSVIVSGFTFLASVLSGIVDFLSKPLSYLLAFLEGVFYFFSKLFDVVVETVMATVAVFQFFFAIAAGLVRTLISWLSFSPDSMSPVNYPSVSADGIGVITTLLQNTGLMTVVPMILLAFVWLFFVFRILGLLSGEKIGGGE